jgi:hypothetical protein
MFPPLNASSAQRVLRLRDPQRSRYILRECTSSTRSQNQHGCVAQLLMDRDNEMDAMISDEDIEQNLRSRRMQIRAASNTPRANTIALFIVPPPRVLYERPTDKFADITFDFESHATPPAEDDGAPFSVNHRGKKVVACLGYALLKQASRFFVTVRLMGSVPYTPEKLKRSSAAVSVMLLLAIWLSSEWQSAEHKRALNGTLHVAASTNRHVGGVIALITQHDTPSAINRRAVATDAIAALNHRWDAIWSTDVSAANANVATLDIAVDLVARAKLGDLDATADLVGAATWCIAGGPLVNVTDVVGNQRRACFERFGDEFASRAQLERAVLVWVLQLAAAGLDDAALYASAMLRGRGADLLADIDNDPTTREQQQAQLLGQLQTLAERGSADAASELHGHWSGASAFRLRDERLANYYAALTQRLDPARELVAIAQ